MALRSSVSAADIRFERKRLYEYTNKKSKDNIRTAKMRYAPVEHHATASSTTVAKNLRRGADVSLSNATITGKKHQSEQDDPDWGARKLPRRMGNPAEEAFKLPRIA